MKRLLLAFLLSTSFAQTPPPTPQHEANFDAERKQANDLFVAGKLLESLPLYEDLCRQDQTVAVFAERHGSALLKQAMTLTDPAAQKAAHDRGLAEIRRAQKLGDNSPYVQTILAVQAKNAVGSIVTGVPLTIGYRYQGSPEAQASMKEAEAAFAREDLAGALKLYQSAAKSDPAWYVAPLYAGDMYYRLKDVHNAGIWFQKAIDIDPDRETAYRYWADALTKAGDRDGARRKIELAYVAEPYNNATWAGLQQWTMLNKAPKPSVPQIARPNFATKDGVLQPDAALASEVATGGSSWLAYEACRVKHGSMTPGQFIVAGSTDKDTQLHPAGYRHSLAEEGECLRATIADVKTKIAAKDLDEESLTPALKLLMQIDKDGMLECWILLNAADAGIRYDYTEFRKTHRDLLVAYVDKYIMPTTKSAP